MLSHLRQRVLQSVAFRSGYRLIPHDDPRVSPLPDLGVPVQLSLLHCAQVGSSDLDADFLSRIIAAIQTAKSTSLQDIDERIPADHVSKGAVQVWPGTHYRLLAAMVHEYRPKVVIEIGTAAGLGYLALASRLADDARLVTFDVVPHDRIPDSRLRPSDFREGHRFQVIADLSDESTFLQYSELFRSCDLLFIDGPKDGRFEYRFWDLLCKYRLAPGCMVVLDDIRLSNMLKFWRDVDLPKIDLVSFGHFTGTGVLWWR